MLPLGISLGSSSAGTPMAPRIPGPEASRACPLLSRLDWIPYQLRSAGHRRSSWAGSLTGFHRLTGRPRLRRWAGVQTVRYRQNSRPCSRGRGTGGCWCGSLSSTELSPDDKHQRCGWMSWQLWHSRSNVYIFVCCMSIHCDMLLSDFQAPVRGIVR